MEDKAHIKFFNKNRLLFNKGNTEIYSILLKTLSSINIEDLIVGQSYFINLKNAEGFYDIIKVVLKEIIDLEKFVCWSKGDKELIFELPNKEEHKETHTSYLKLEIFSNNFTVINNMSTQYLIFKSNKFYEKFMLDSLYGNLIRL